MFLRLALLGALWLCVLMNAPVRAQNMDEMEAAETPFRLITILSNSRVSNISTIVTGDRLLIRISGGPRWVDLNTLESRDLPADIIGIDRTGTQALAYDRLSDTSYLIDLETGERRGTLRSQIRQHRFSDDSRLLITRSAFPVVDQVWDAETGTLIGSLAIAADTASPPMPIFRPESADIVARSAQGEIHLWNIETASPRMTLAMSAPLGWQFLSDGQTLVTWNAERAALWNAETGDLLSTLPLSADERLIDVIVSPDDRRLIIHSQTLALPQARRLRLWDIQNIRSAVLISTYTQPVGSTRGEIIRVEISGDSRIAAAYSDHLPTVNIYDLENGRLIQQLEMRSNAVTSGVFAEGDRWLILSDQYDQTVVWERQNGVYTPVRTLPAGDLVLSDSGSTLLINSFSSAYLYDLTTRRMPEDFRVRATNLLPNLPVYSAPSLESTLLGTLPTGNTIIAGWYDGFYFLDDVNGWIPADANLHLQDNLPSIDVPRVRPDGSRL
jgi:WD40 repeat protein